MSPYLTRNYIPVGVADIVSPTQTNYLWDHESERYEIKGNSAMRVFMRKTAATP